MAADGFDTAPTKEEDTLPDNYTYRRDFAPPKWWVNHGGNKLWPWAGKKYEELRTNNNDGADEACLGRTAAVRRRRSAWYTVAIVVSIIAMAAYIFATIPLAIRAYLARPRYHCGSTIEEAKARGCTFDPMTVQWLPQQCSRAGLDDFLIAHGTHSTYAWASTNETTDPGARPGMPQQTPGELTWRYYTDDTQRFEYPNGLVDAPIGHYTYTTTRGEHLAHCAYILVRGAEARAAGERLDTLSGDLTHSRHCAMFLFEYARHAPHFETVNTPGDVMLGQC